MRKERAAGLNLDFWRFPGFHIRMYAPSFTPWKSKPAVEAGQGRPRRWFQYLITAAGRLIVRTMMKVYRIDLENPERAVEQYAGALAGKSRFLIAFRHPGDDDPQIVYLAFNSLINPWLKKAGLPAHLGAIFLAGSEIPLWGGPLVALVLRKAGTIPVSHGTLSKSTMDAIMATLTDTPTPIALAPEGQVTYYSHVVPDFDQGTAQIAMWAQGRLDDRFRKGQAPAAQVNVLPVGVVYGFPKETWRRLDRFVRDAERMAGLERALPRELRKAARRKGGESPESREAKALLEHFRERIKILWERIASEGIEYYRRAYQYQGDEPGASTEDRMRALCGFAMERAEAYYGYQGKGSLRERVMFLRTHSMALAFAPKPRGKKATWLERRLAERGAGDAYWLHRHQEIVDLSWYLTENTVTGFATFDRAVESAQNLLDLAQRFVGGNFGTRRKYFKKAVSLRFGQPIAVSESLQKGRREAISDISDRLRKGFEELL